MLEFGLKGGRDDIMMRRIFLWSVAGLIVACAWIMISIVVGPDYNLVRWTVVEVTAPGWLIGHSMQLNQYWTVLINCAAYAVIGMLLEAFLPSSR